MSKKIILTGGGTAGHVTPNIALILPLLANNWEVHYLGMKSGFERELLENIAEIQFHPIDSGKLRRYVDWKNLSDIYHILNGYFESKKLIQAIKPDIVFSKGGYVSVPVVIAASKQKVPVIIHESDMTPGLANRICAKYATKICTSFPETLSAFPKDKTIYTGSPVRSFLKNGNPANGRTMAGFTDDKPILLVLGGSQGSVFINHLILEALPAMTKNYQVLLVSGHGNEIDIPKNGENYFICDYLKNEMADCLAMADIVISRAGANILFELLAINKPSLLIPLTLKSSRGDQLENAKNFERHGFSIVLTQENITTEKLVETLHTLICNADLMIKEMKSYPTPDTINLLLDLFQELSGSSPLPL